jgi:hypothetical protein
MYYDIPTPPAKAASPTRTGYYNLANSTSRAPVYVPPPEQECPSCGTQWAAENATGLIIGGLGVLASGIGIGYLLGANNQKKDKSVTLNSLKDKYANVA